MPVDNAEVRRLDGRIDGHADRIDKLEETIYTGNGQEAVLVRLKSLEDDMSQRGTGKATKVTVWIEVAKFATVPVSGVLTALLMHWLGVH